MSVDVHDFELTGIRVERDSGVVVSLFDGSVSQGFDLGFRRVKRIVVDGFAMQNIVFELKIFSEREASFEFQRCCFLLGIDSSNPREIDDGDSMVFIEASVGAEVALLMDGAWEGGGGYRPRCETGP